MSVLHPAFNRRAIPEAAHESQWAAKDGQLIRRIDWPQAHNCRGSILFMPGRGDCYEKYLETLNYWHSQGWQVTASDWRGQAGSGRLGKDAYTGHINDFSVWIEDLADLWQQWIRSNPGPHILIGHSMGGHLVLRALVEKAVAPAAAVLVAPMLGFINHGVPAVLMQVAAKVMCAIGDPRRQAWKWGEKPGAVPANRNLLLTHDDLRYADEMWWREHRPAIAMGPGSWGWTERAYESMRKVMQTGVLERVTTPVLLLSTDHDKLVDHKMIEQAANKLTHSELIRFGAEARHELLRESDRVRDPALTAINTFLDRITPVKG